MSLTPLNEWLTILIIQLFSLPVIGTLSLDTPQQLIGLMSNIILVHSPYVADQSKMKTINPFFAGKER